MPHGRLNADEPGGDSTAGTIHSRRKIQATLMIGPPQNRILDAKVIDRLLSAHGRKVVCGGTTGAIVAGRLNRPIRVLLKTAAEGIPPIGRLVGVDLLTEGVLTLAGTVEIMRRNRSLADVERKTDGASRLYRELLLADEIRILLGQAMNPAHQDPDTPGRLGLKFHWVDELQFLLARKGKTVTVEKF